MHVAMHVYASTGTVCMHVQGDGFVDFFAYLFSGQEPCTNASLRGRWWNHSRAY